MLLWLLRHADALPPSGTPDESRPLSQLGRRQARSTAAFLSRSHIPSAIVTSPFLRAVQTAEVIAHACAVKRVETSDALLSGATHAELLRFLHHRKEESLLLVGHEPLMSSFGSLLSSGHSSSVLRFSPCTLALLRLAGKPRPDGATLEILLPPDVLTRKRPSEAEKHS